jgi:hypothetical protein
MQVARVYADYASPSKGREPFFVTFQTLLHCTHLSREKASRSLTWLRDHGWLERLPAPEGEHQQRAYHRLLIPESASDVAKRRSGFHVVDRFDPRTGSEK